jgi:hypothetical protein
MRIPAYKDKKRKLDQVRPNTLKQRFSAHIVFETRWHSHVVSDASWLCFSVAGNWLFIGRRWLDPQEPDDRHAIDASYEALCTRFPDFSRCSRESLLRALSEVSSSWNRRLSSRHATNGLSPCPSAARTVHLPVPQSGDDALAILAWHLTRKTPAEEPTALAPARHAAGHGCGSGGGRGAAQLARGPAMPARASPGSDAGCDSDGFLPGRAGPSESPASVHHGHGGAAAGGGGARSDGGDGWRGDRAGEAADGWRGDSAGEAVELALQHAAARGMWPDCHELERFLSGSGSRPPSPAP